MRKRRILEFIAFFVGLSAGLTLLSGLGKLASEFNYYNGVTRFGQWLSADANHFPSYYALKNWALSQARQEKTTVVLGGSSVIHGVGQRLNHSFASKLQRYLGDDYVVLNLATRGGLAGGTGALIAGSLASNGYPVIYLTDFLPGTPAFPDAERYQYLFWSAKYSGDLSPNEDLLKIASADHTWSRRLMLLDSQLHFVDFFNYISTNIVKINYSPYFADINITPLVQYGDTERDPLGFSKPTFDPNEVEGIRGLWANSISELQWIKFNESLGITKISSLDRIIFVYCKNAPQYTSISTLDSKNWAKVLDRSISLLRTQGISVATPCNGLTSEDYSDRVHLSEKGASKVAQDVSKLLIGLK